jgi:hypothetical protein
VSFDDSVHRGQPEPAARELGGEVRIEDPSSRRRVHAAARVGDLDEDVPACGQVGLRRELRQVTRVGLHLADLDGDFPDWSSRESEAFVSRFITTCRICVASP